VVTEIDVTRKTIQYELEGGVEDTGRGGGESLRFTNGSTLVGNGTPKKRDQKIIS